MMLIRNIFITLSISFLTATAAAHEHAPGSPDAAKKWAENLARSSGTGVSVAADEAGVLWLARMQDGHIRVSRSEDGGKHFAPGVKVNPSPESILAEGQNRPKIAVHGGVIAVLWAQARPKMFAGHIRFSRSTDGGKTYTAPITINENREEIGHSYGAMAFGKGGRIALIWLDSREKSAAGRTGKKYSGSTVYYSISDDAGATFAANRKLADHSCECCRIGLTFDPDGVPVALWRHVFDGNLRDFALARLESTPAMLRASEDRWAIDACPHHGGDIASDGAGGRHLVWFTGNPAQPGLFYRRSDGAQMSAPHAFGDSAAQAGYPTVSAAGKKVNLAWREFDGKGYRLMSLFSQDRGATWSPPRIVAQTAGAADLPLFATGSDKPLLVWNSNADGVRIFNLDDHGASQ